MNYKKVLFISLFVLILSVSVVSAADLNNENVSDSSINIDDSLVSGDIGDVNIGDSEVSASPGSFNDLQNEINNVPSGSVLNFTRDYNGAEYLKIQINKDLTIDGQGHTINCLGKADCSAFYSSSGNIVLKNLKIINGHNDDNHQGGAIHIEGSAQYTLENCILNDNWADDYGGAIYNGVEKPLTIKNCVFKSNKADDDDGGAIYSRGDVNIADSIFSSNHACGMGGAICSKKTVNVENCLFESNEVKHFFFECHGGAISAEDDVIINNCTFNNNWADDYGGAIYSRNDVYVNENQESGDFTSFFIKNTAEDNDGGAIKANNVVAVNAMFNENSADVNGGAIYAKYDVDVRHCRFESNKANGATSDRCHGGAVYAQFNVTVSNSTFKKNYAENMGGALSALRVILENPSYFEGNVARDYGGAIYTGKFDKDVKYASFINNKAENDDGGAIYIENQNWITFSQCVFVNNYCDEDGGAIYVKSTYSHLTLKNNIFIGNTADSEGQSVFNSGYYDAISNNWWSRNPTSSNDQLIEYHYFKPNEHHVDSNPLEMDLVLDKSFSIPCDNITATLTFYNHDGSLFTGIMSDNYLTYFTCSPEVKSFNQDRSLNDISVKFMPEKAGIYTISSNLYGKSISKELNVSKIDIIAPEITTYYDVPAEFKIHLDKDGMFFANQKVTVSLDSVDYEVFTNETGDASIYFNNYTLYPGTYNILIKAFNIYSQSAITILPNITIVAPEISSYFGAGNEFKIHLDGDKRFTINQKAIITFDFIDYEVCTDENGDASIYLKSNASYSNKYPISINVLNVNAQSAFDLKPTIYAEDIVRTYGDYTPFNATFIDSNGKYLPDCTAVQYVIDNSNLMFMNVRGDEGQVSFSIASLNPGFHSITLFNLETKNYKEFSITILPQSAAAD